MLSEIYLNNKQITTNAMKGVLYLKFNLDCMKHLTLYLI